MIFIRKMMMCTFGAAILIQGALPGAMGEYTTTYTRPGRAPAENSWHGTARDLKGSGSHTSMKASHWKDFNRG